MNLSFINESYLPIMEGKYILYSQCQAGFEMLSFNHFLIIIALLFLSFVFSLKLEDSLYSRLIRGSLIFSMVLFALMTESLSRFVYINKLEYDILNISSYVICIIGLIYAGWQLDKYLKKRKETIKK